MELTNGDSQLPGIFQEPEADITKGVKPEKFTKTENVVEKIKDVEAAVEQKKEAKCLLLIIFLYVFLANLKNI